MTASAAMSMAMSMVIDVKTIKTIEVSEFEAKCLQLMDRVARPAGPW